MKTLFITRHAKSSWTAPDLDDFDRPLNKRGKFDAPRIGRYLQQQGLLPDHIVSSPARRAQSTARILAESLTYPADKIVRNAEVYLAEVDVLLQIIRAAPESCSRQMLVGHNPGLTELSNALTDAHIENLPTCGVVVIGFEVTRWQQVDWHSGIRQFFFYPKMLDKTV